jgi:hypothetical protein
MVTDSVRLLVQAESSGSAGELAVRRALRSLGSTAGWRIEPLFPDDANDLFVLRRAADITVSTRDAFELAYMVRSRPGIIDAEPDLPIEQYPEFEPETVGAFGDAPSPDDLAWAHRAIKVDRAWAAHSARGAGVLVGHPDTGYTRHWIFGPQQAALDLVRDHDFVEDDEDAEDPLEKGLPLTKFPGHGTGTGGVIVGRAGAEVQLPGVAPEAVLVPVRTVNSVIQLFDTDVARAVEHVRRMGCHVVSMSLGGKGLIGLRAAIDRALDSGLIVLAAAGNWWPFVVAPASYPTCIAVAATDRNGVPWEGSARGRAVAISAPGSGCYGAAWDLASRTQTVTQKHGTSYGVVHVAGAAVLWLSHHGVDALRQRYPGRLLQEAFRTLLTEVAHEVPDDWEPDRYGVGILNVEKLLDAELPDPDVLTPAGAFEVEAPTGVGRIAETFSSLSEAEVRERLAAVGAVGAVDEAALDRTSAELLYLLMSDPEAAARFSGDGVGAFGGDWAERLRPAATPQLGAVLGPA